MASSTESKVPERRAWAVMVMPVPPVMELFGSTRSSNRLHWTQAEARTEGARFASELGGDSIQWQEVDDLYVIGRFPGYAIVLRRVLLPLGEPPDRA